MRSPAMYGRINTAIQLYGTGAAPQAKYSAAIQTQRVEIGTLACTAAATAKTNTLTMTAVWQVSDDGSTYVDLVEGNNAASVTLATGTGTSATTIKALTAPPGVYGYKFARLKVYTGVTTADGTDDGVTFGVRYIKA